MRLLPVFFTVLVFAGCRRSADPTPAAFGPPLTVVTDVARAEKLPVRIEAPATVRPAERASVAAKLAGTVVSFPAGLGATVQAGEVLLTLQAPETEARLRQAQANLAEADRIAARQRTLVASGVNPSDALRDAEDRLRFAQAAVAEAEALLAYATVRAPFAGVITEKNVLPGDLATPGAPLLVIESTQRLRAEGSVPEKAANGLRIGLTVQVMLDDASAPVAGQVEEISGAADAVSRSVLVKVLLPAGVARSGQFARLLVESGTTEAILVPASAVTRYGQIERVFVIEQGRAVLRLVKTGRLEGSRIEVLSGLNPRETVIVAPPAALRESQPVAAQP